MGLWSGRSREERGFRWWFKSKKGPRFTGSGTTFGLFGSNEAITEAVRALEKRFRCKAPSDLEGGGMKW